MVLYSPKGRKNAIIAGAYFAAMVSSSVFFLLKFNVIQGTLLAVAYLASALMLLDLLEAIWLDLMNLNYPVVYLLKLDFTKKEHVLGTLFGLFLSALMFLHSSKFVFLNQLSMIIQALAIFLSPVSYIFSTAIFAIIFNIIQNISSINLSLSSSLFSSILAVGLVSILEVVVLYYRKKLLFENIEIKINYLYLFIFLLFIFILTIFQRKIIEINISFIIVSLCLTILSIGLARTRGEGLFIPLGLPAGKLLSNILLPLTLFFPLPAALFESLSFQSLKRKRERTRFLLFLSGLTAATVSLIYVFENRAYGLEEFSELMNIDVSSNIYMMLTVAAISELARTFVTWLPVTPYALPHSIIVGQNISLLTFSIIAGLVKYFVIKVDVKLYTRKIRPFVVGFTQTMLLAFLLAAL